jgi:adenylate cyclase
MPDASSAGLNRDEVAARGGVDPAFIDDLVRLGMLAPVDGRFNMGDARRALILRSLAATGFSIEAIGTAVRQGILALDFADLPTFERFATVTDQTFAQVSERSRVPVELLLVIREAIGDRMASPADRLREDELAVVPFIETQVRLGFRAGATERLLRAMGESLHRIAEAEAAWFRSEVAEPLLAQGRANEIAGVDPGVGLSETMEAALLGIWHAQQAQSWMSNLVEGFEYVMTRAGLHKRDDRPPGICFLDITGYTRLTQEHGDAAAAALAEQMATLVNRSSIDHGGRAVKWLGDGVMFYFRDPAQGVLAALDMVAAIPAAGLPPAHVGIHAGPVVVQQGDYYGQTVNLAARMADYARPGEVLVSQPVLDASRDASVRFVDIGEVELKGVAGTVHLYSAST